VKSGKPPTRASQNLQRQVAGIALEQFHLAFLEAATAQLPLDRFALKGGANLRFFLRSLRRSVDMDFDYLGDPQHSWAFAERVDKIFASNALQVLLRAREIALVSVRKPKQTDTTRRWRFGLNAPGVDGVPSKIEFSARTRDRHAADYELAPVDAELARRLRARPVRLNHYRPPATIAQKIGALRLRSETQPRDVFDLDHLFREFPDALAAVAVPVEELQAAVERARALSYDEYAGTVVPYLEEGIVEVLGTSEAWTQMQLRVVERLEWKERQR
jgi:hypothetical protein